MSQYTSFDLQQRRGVRLRETFPHQWRDTAIALCRDRCRCHDHCLD
jgi:hypothetical protein